MPLTTRGKPWRFRVWAKFVRPHRWGPWVMQRFLRYWAPKRAKFPTAHDRASQSNTFFLIKKKQKPEGERPALFAIESYLAGIVTSLDSSGSSGRVPRILERVCVPLRRGGGFSHRVHQVQDKSTATAGGRHPTKHPGRYSSLCVALFYWPEGEEDYKRGLQLPWDLLQNSPLLLCR